MTYIQDPPFSCQIESVEGCTIRCPFCGINGIRTEERTYKYLSPERAALIAAGIAEAGWTCRCEWGMHGEPTKNSLLPQILQIFRRHLPSNYFLMETNGGGFLGKDSEEVLKKIQYYFASGLDTIALDEYQNIPWANAVRKAGIKEHAKEMGVTFHEYPADPVGNPHNRVKHKRFVIIAPIDLSDHGTHSSLNNHCGAGGPLDESLKHKRCAKPFRELSIRWDGSVAICCNDWRGVYKIGNVFKTPIKDLWQSPRFNAARRKLLHYQRDFAPCLGCNAKSYRTGLLPDKFGKETLPKPDAKTDKILKEAIAGPSYTEAVERPWESGLVQIKGRSLI